jgi:hypothetical protein
MTIREGRYDLASVPGILKQVVHAINAGALSLQLTVDATAAEINKLHSVTAGTSSASKAAVLGANKNLDELRVDTTFKLGATTVTATAAELNKLAGVTGGTTSASKAVVVDANKHTDVLNLPVSGLGIGVSGSEVAVTASGAELNTMTGILATTAELNRAADLSTRVVAVNASASISIATHDSKILLMGGAGSLRTHTLPAAAGTGARFRFVVGAVNTSGYKIQVTTTDVMYGVINSVNDSAAPIAWATAADSDTITLDGTTKGGVAVGDWIEVEDVATGKWVVRGQTNSSGTEATPFSAAVS